MIDQILEARKKGRVARNGRIQNIVSRTSNNVLLLSKEHTDEVNPYYMLYIPIYARISN